jgi:N-methylhydantoinase A
MSRLLEILPEIREFERFSTTALNAYLQPEVSGYLDRLDAALTRRAVRRRVPDRAVQRRRHVTDTACACRCAPRCRARRPGVIAAGAHRRGRGLPNVITGDMGGTSFDVSLIAGARVVLAPQTSIDFGMVVRTPMIEITTIGAGGGSIAWVDKGGLLNIGPESAGSDPGPVAYGLGNDRPTVTDANVVLGRIDPETPSAASSTGSMSTGAARAIDDPCRRRRWG